MIPFLVYLLAWGISCLISWIYFSDCDKTAIEVIVLFTPVNVPILLFVGIGTLCKWIFEWFKKKIKQMKIKRAGKKMRDVDPYGEEDWTE